MTFQIVLASEPYYYNCQGCGCVLMVPGDIPQTEALRKRGVCEDCMALFRKELKTKRITLFTNIPWANAGLN